MANLLNLSRLRVWFTPQANLPLPNPGISLRGALGLALNQLGPEGTDLFAGRAPVTRPSGYREIPRPFVLQSAHLAGLSFGPAAPFLVSLTLFDLQPRTRQLLLHALSLMAANGLGPSLTPCALSDPDWADFSFPLASPVPPFIPERPLHLEFSTPLELRDGGKVLFMPEFPTLVSRLRDRIAALSAFYGEGPPALDFATFANLAQSVRLVSHTLQPRRARRHSTRTGQWHPVNGFTGTAVYHGPWAAYETWLRAGEYTGVGRHTAFGNGSYRIREAPDQVK